MITCIDDKVKFITLLLTIHYYNLFLMTRDENLYTQFKNKIYNNYKKKQDTTKHIFEIKPITKK